MHDEESIRYHHSTCFDREKAMIKLLIENIHLL